MINQCIVMFEELKEYKYILHFEKKKRKKCIEITFEDADFFHLFGLQYLTDLKPRFKGSTSNTYRKIIKDERLKKAIMDSNYYELIEDRVISFSELKNILNSEFAIYEYIKPDWTLIEAHFVLKHRALENQSFIFLTQRETAYFVACTVVRDSRNFVEERNRYKTTKKKFELLEIG